MKDTIQNIKGYIQSFKNTLLVHLQNDVEFAYKYIDTAVGTFVEPPPETPPPPEEPDPDGEPCAEPEPPQAPVSDSPVESERTKEHKAVGLRSLLSKLKRAIKKRATKIVEIFPAKKGKAKTHQKVNGKITGKEKK